MEQNIVYCQVKDQYIIGAGQVVGAVGSHDDVLLRLDFSESPNWRDLTKRCIFTDALGENPTPVVLTPNLLAEGQTDVYLCPVPAEAKAAEGMCLLTIQGVLIQGDNEVIKAVTKETEFKVLPSRLTIPTGQHVTPDQADQLNKAIHDLDAGITGRIDEKVKAHNEADDSHKDIRAKVDTKLDSNTIKSAGIPEIVSAETLRSYFYAKRKETSRSWQFEVSSGSNENIVNALGGFPDGHTASERWFLYINLPYTEAGGFAIHAQLEGRTNGKLYRQDQFATLDANWHSTGWIRIEDVQKHLDDHIADKGNPHGVTYEQAGADKAGAAGAALAAAKNYADEQDAAGLSSAKAYADRQDRAVLAAAKNYADGAYTLPAASSTALGGIKAPPASEDQTGVAGIDEQGRIRYKPGSGGGGGGNDLAALDTGIDEKNRFTIEATLQDGAKVTALPLPLPATVKVGETISAITNEDTFRTYFYDLRKSPSRKYQFEWSEGGIHQNIHDVLGLPLRAPADAQYFYYVWLPFSEAGGFIIHVTLEGRTNGVLAERKIYATLNSNWHDTGWYQPTHVTRVVIAPHGGGMKADLTASEIINAARRGVVLADYTDPKTGELRTYQYSKQMPDGRAVFSKDGYIENGTPKQTLIYVDYAGNVTTETRDATAEGVGAIPTLKTKVVRAVTEEEIDQRIMDAYATMAPDSRAHFVLSVEQGGLSLDGGAWDLDMSKSSDKYGFITATSYSGMARFRRILNGILADWLKYATLDTAGHLPAEQNTPLGERIAFPFSSGIKNGWGCNFYKNAFGEVVLSLGDFTRTPAFQRGQWTAIGTLPVGYRPAVHCYYTGLDGNYNTMFFAVTDAGVVSVNLNGSPETGNAGRLCCVFST